MFVPFIYSLSDFTAGTYVYFCSFVHAVGPKALQAIQIDIEFEKNFCLVLCDTKVSSVYI